METMKKLGYLVLFVMLAGSAQAQEYLTLNKAREMALTKSEDIKMAEAKQTQAQNEQKAARTKYLPSLSASATSIYLFNDIESEYYLPTYNTNATTGALEPNVMTDASGAAVIGADGNPVFNQYAYLPFDLSLKGAFVAGVSIEQPIYTGGKINSGNRMADIGVEMAEENKQLQRVNTVVEADKAYWLYVAVQSKVKLADTNLTMLEALLKRVQNSFDVGLIKKNEVLKVQVEYDRAKLDLQKAKSGLELTRMSLCRVTGLPFDTAIKTDTSLVINRELVLSQSVEDVTRRPEYQLLSKSVEMESARVKTVRADYLPTLGIRGGYSYFGQIEFDDKTINEGGISVLASAKIPLFNWGEGHRKVAAATAGQNAKELELQKNSQLMQLEIENARLNLQDAALRIEMSESALVQASENLRVSRDNYEVGKELLSDLLLAQTQWAKASSELLDAKTSFKVQETEYLRVTSSLLQSTETEN